MNLRSIQNNFSYAHVVPFAAFLVLNLLMGIPGIEWAHPHAPWWREWPEQWMYPLQSLIVGVILVFFWKKYSFSPPKGLLLGATLGVAGIGIWILPTALYDYLGYDSESVGLLKYFGFASRREGFDPGVLLPEFGNIGYWLSTLMRFFRAVIIVALVEELFWRGFLMRFLLNPDGKYWNQPFGRPQLLSYLVTTGAFILIHQPIDYIGAFFFGSLMYWLAVRTKSLAACVIMHAVANLIMGIYALQMGKFGLW